MYTWRVEMHNIIKILSSFYNSHQIEICHLQKDDFDVKMT
jgi:hypothetical protein